MNVEGDDFFLDLLFYNYHIHCFIVFELKVGDFKPEYTGKLNFYINTINERIKGKEDKPTIGVLLCKTPNDTVVKFSLQGINTPMGVADYEFTKALPKQLKGEMPTIEELGFTYQLHGFKKAGTENFGEHQTLKFEFNEYWYGFTLLNHNNQQPFIKKLYHQPITNEDQQEIIDLIMTKVMDRIEWILEFVKNKNG